MCFQLYQISRLLLIPVRLKVMFLFDIDILLTREPFGCSTSAFFTAARDSFRHQKPETNDLRKNTHTRIKGMHAHASVAQQQYDDLGFYNNV